MTTKLQKNDIGTRFVLAVRQQSLADPDVLEVVDVSAATSMAIHFEKPDGTTFSRVAILDTDGHDGKLAYVTVANDINAAGRWICQMSATIGGWVGRSDTHAFYVQEIIS